MWGLRQSLTGGITETMVKQAHEGERPRPQARCPRCTRVLKGHDHVWRTVETMGGPGELERPSCYGRACRAGLSPRDDALGLVAGGHQLDTAPSLCGALPGMHCGSARLHTVTNQVDAGLTGLDVAPSRQEIARRIASVSAGRLRRPGLVLGMDGASVPTRPDRAREPGEPGGGGSGVPRRACASL